MAMVTINQLLAAECRLVALTSFDFFTRGLHIRATVACLPLRQLGFLVDNDVIISSKYIKCRLLLVIYNV